MSETATQMNRHKITFIAPDGSDLSAPDPSFLQDLIMSSGDDYWQGASGDAALWFDRGDGKRARLILMEDESAGFFLLYKNPESGGDFHPASDDESDQTVTIYVGGEPMEINAADFVSREKAWEAVAYFLNEGERDPDLDWRKW